MRRFFRFLLLFLDAVLIVAFVAGYLARYIAPRYAWWTGLVATVLPYLALALLPSALLVALLRKWPLLSVHLALLFLAALRFASFSSGVEAGPNDLDLLTYNTSRGGGIQAETQGRAITALIRSEAPDLITLQEASIEFHPSEPHIRPSIPLAALIDSLGYYTIGPTTDGNRATYTFQPVLGTVRLLEQTQVVLPKQQAEERETRVVRTRFLWQGREAILYNLHLQTFGSQKPWEEGRFNPFTVDFWTTYWRQYRLAFLVRAREAAQIRAMLEQEHLPLIVSGDFNSTPHNWSFHKLAKGYQEAFRVAGRGWGSTYHADFPFSRIDHVLVSPEWDVVAAHVGQAAHSDHLPLVVRLRWKE